MLTSKKKKIRIYLESTPYEDKTGFDLDEPHEYETYPMASKDHFYQTLANTICDLM